MCMRIANFSRNGGYRRLYHEKPSCNRGGSGKSMAHKDKVAVARQAPLGALDHQQIAGISLLIGDKDRRNFQGLSPDHMFCEGSSFAGGVAAQFCSPRSRGIGHVCAVRAMRQAAARTGAARGEVISAACCRCRIRSCPVAPGMGGARDYRSGRATPRRRPGCVVFRSGDGQRRCRNSSGQDQAADKLAFRAQLCRRRICRPYLPGPHSIGRCRPKFRWVEASTRRCVDAIAQQCSDALMR